MNLPLPITIRRTIGVTSKPRGYIVQRLSPLWCADIPQVLTTLRVMLEASLGRHA